MHCRSNGRKDFKKEIFQVVPKALTSGSEPHIMKWTAALKALRKHSFILGCAPVCAFTHRFKKGFRVDVRMSCPRFSPGEGSKQSQVSALPERRVKKQRLTALMGYMSILRMLFFCVRMADISPLFEYIICEMSAS